MEAYKQGNLRMIEGMGRELFITKMIKRCQVSGIKTRSMESLWSSLKIHKKELYSMLKGKK